MQADSSNQRRLWILLAIGIGSMLFSTGIVLRQRLPQPRIALTNRINPNTASPGSLSRLPGIGIHRAEAIVRFRRKHVFSSSSDLLAVPGIGPAIVKRIAPHLCFDS